MKWSVDDIPSFVATVDRQGVTAAAEYLGVPKSSVSRSISRLEDALGVRLLERNSRNIRITSEGEVFYRRCQLILDEVADTNAEMSGLTTRPSGKLVVSMPMAFSREVFSRCIPLFFQQFPAVELEVMVTSHSVDVIRENIDVAIMPGPLHDSELVARKLLDNQLVWVSSPGYLARHDSQAIGKAFASHVKICETRYGKSRQPIVINGKKELLDLRHAMLINDPLMVRDAVLAGAGISIMPLLYCQHYLREGSLVHALPTIQSESTGIIAAVYPSRRHISKKVRAFIEFLQDILAERYKSES